MKTKVSKKSDIVTYERMLQKCCQDYWRILNNQQAYSPYTQTLEQRLAEAMTQQLRGTMVQAHYPVYDDNDRVEYVSGALLVHRCYHVHVVQHEWPWLRPTCSSLWQVHVMLYFQLSPSDNERYHTLLQVQVPLFLLPPMVCRSWFTEVPLLDYADSRRVMTHPYQTPVLWWNPLRRGLEHCTIGYAPSLTDSERLIEAYNSHYEIELAAQEKHALLRYRPKK